MTDNKMTTSKRILSQFSSVAALVALSVFSPMSLDAAVAQNDVALKSGVWPVMVRMEYNPILQIKVQPSSSARPDKLEALKIDFSKTTNVADIEAVDVFVGGNDAEAGTLFGTAKPTKSNPILTIRAIERHGSESIGEGADVVVLTRHEFHATATHDSISALVAHHSTAILCHRCEVAEVVEAVTGAVYVVFHAIESCFGKSTHEGGCGIKSG